MGARTPILKLAARSIGLAALLLAPAWCCPVQAQSEIPVRSTVQDVALDVEADQASYCRPDKWVYFDADYLLWWVRGAQLPPLVTSSPQGTAIQDAGVLGEPATRVLYGDELTSSGPWSGVRLRGGMGLDDFRQWWLIVDGFYLPMFSESFEASTQSESILARPFYDTAIGDQNAQLISYPGFVDGNIGVDVWSQLWGAGVALRKNVYCCPGESCDSGYRLDFLVGYRYLELSEGVEIYEDMTATDPQGPLLLGTRLELQDLYTSESRFQGVELGLAAEAAGTKYFIAGECRVALGQTQHHLQIDGSTRVSVPGQPDIGFPGGLLAPGEHWDYSDQEFSVVPQADIRVGRRFSDRIRLSVGYSLLYWSQVVRAGEHISTTLNSNQLPLYGGTPLAASAMPLQSSSFWAQGLSFRFEWQY
jgi:hypothetical protein